MFEVESFGNLVNSLRSVRDDYHEHLKAVPQYDAFLLVENSTAKVTGTLQSLVSSTTPSMAAEVIEALETARTKFKQHLTSVPEYRALLAIDKLIAEVATDLGTKTETSVEAAAAVDVEAVASVATAVSETVTSEAATLDVPETATQEAAVATETVEAQALEQEHALEQEQATSAVAQESDLAPQAIDEAPVPTDADLLAQHAIARIENALREEHDATETTMQEETEPTVHASVDTSHDMSTPHHETSDADVSTDAPETDAPDVEPHKYGEERAA
jgi:hypothetical protein